MVGQPQRRNPTSSTEIVGNITVADSQDSGAVALCTLDGRPHSAESALSTLPHGCVQALLGC